MHKYLQAIKENKTATRIKLRVKIFADCAFQRKYSFSAGNFEIELLPIHDKGRFEAKNGLFIAFECTAVTSNVLLDNRAALDKELNIFFTIAQASYCLDLRTEEWREIDKEWIPWLTSAGEGYTVTIINDDSVSKSLEIHGLARKSILQNKEFGRRTVTCLDLLRRGLDLELLWPNESFLNFYKVLEIIADSLKKNQQVIDPLQSKQIVQDLVSLNIIGDGTQKIKMYFLINVFDLDSPSKTEIIELAEKRNKIAHSSYTIDARDLKICKNLAFDVLSRYLSLNLR